MSHRRSTSLSRIVLPRVLIGSEITVFAFAEILNPLQTANAASLKDLDRVCAVIIALLPDGGTNVPSARELRTVLLARLPLRAQDSCLCAGLCIVLWRACTATSMPQPCMSTVAILHEWCRALGAS